MCEYLFLIVLCQSVMDYCTALSAVLKWICALHVFIIIIVQWYASRSDLLCDAVYRRRPIPSRFPLFEHSRGWRAMYFVIWLIAVKANLGVRILCFQGQADSSATFGSQRERHRKKRFAVTQRFRSRVACWRWCQNPRLRVLFSEAEAPLCFLVDDLADDRLV